MALYPLSAMRAMNYAAAQVFKELQQSGHVGGMLDNMQTRDDLYNLLDYKSQEKLLD